MQAISAKTIIFGGVVVVIVYLAFGLSLADSILALAEQIQEKSASAMLEIK